MSAAPSTGLSTVCGRNTGLSYGALLRALSTADRLYPPVSDGSRDHAPWPVLVRLPDGCEVPILAVRANPLAVVLEIDA